jgi:hypothetical protein
MLKIVVIKQMSLFVFTSRFFRKSYDCRYNSRMDYAFCLLTLKSSEKWQAHYLALCATSMTNCNFINTNYVNRKLTSYIYLLIFTISLWLHVKHFIALTKRESAIQCLQLYTVLIFFINIFPSHCYIFIKQMSLFVVEGGVGWYL